MPLHTFGAEAEAHYFPVFQQLFPTLQRIKNPYAAFDFETPDKSTAIELKARRFAHDKYPTTMIGVSKIRYANRFPDTTYFFAFAFTDGLYWIRYDPVLFSTFEVKEGGRYDRGRPEINQYCYIPIEKLEVCAPPLHS